MVTSVKAIISIEGEEIARGLCGNALREWSRSDLHFFCMLFKAQDKLQRSLGDVTVPVPGQRKPWGEQRTLSLPQTRSLIFLPSLQMLGCWGRWWGGESASRELGMLVATAVSKQVQRRRAGLAANRPKAGGLLAHGSGVN